MDNENYELMKGSLVKHDRVILDELAKRCKESARNNFAERDPFFSFESRDTKVTVLKIQEFHIDTLINKIGNLTHLQELDLYFTGLSSLPDTFRHLTKLETLCV
ncbi:MAG: hypothetical protein ACXAC7_09730, partial [Candidatus Hodarchaeales archaeon]